METTGADILLRAYFYHEFANGAGTIRKYGSTRDLLLVQQWLQFGERHHGNPHDVVGAVGEFRPRRKNGDYLASRMLLFKVSAEELRTHAPDQDELLVRA